jgi:membrane protease YdiL (CAAX protease family)
VSAQEPGSGDPYAFPTASVSGLLTLLGFVLMLFVLAPLLTMGQDVLGLSAGMVIGFGLVGTLAARRIPAPADLRIGLRGFPPRLLGLVLLLAPIVFWLSELDNLAAELIGRPDPPEAPGEAPAAGSGLSAQALRTIEIGLFAVLLRPVVEEFFFRGVIQQGAAAQLGTRSGILLSTVLFLTVRTVPAAGDPYAILSVTSQALVEGLLLGTLRHVSGSLLPGILLQGLVNGIGILAVAMAAQLPIEGFNLQEGHMSAAFLVPSGVCVALGILWLKRLAAEVVPLPPCPPPPDPEDDFDD